MKNFKEIKAEEINENTFEIIGKKWMLITAEKSSGEVNTMMGRTWSSLEKKCSFYFYSSSTFY